MVFSCTFVAIKMWTPDTQRASAVVELLPESSSGTLEEHYLNQTFVQLILNIHKVYSSLKCPWATRRLTNTVYLYHVIRIQPIRIQKAVVYSTLLHTTFPSCAALIDCVGHCTFYRIFSLVDIIKLHCYPHRRSTTVSLETFTLYLT